MINSFLISSSDKFVLNIIKNPTKAQTKQQRNKTQARALQICVCWKSNYYRGLIGRCYMKYVEVRRASTAFPYDGMYMK